MLHSSSRYISLQRVCGRARALLPPRSASQRLAAARRSPAAQVAAAAAAVATGQQADGRYVGADAAALSRFYSPHLPPAPGHSVELAADEARHLFRSLRLRPGDALELCDGRGGLVRCELVAADKQRATVCAVEVPRLLPWRGPRLVLAVGCTTLPGGRADWLVEKATELGVHTVVPLVTERSVAGAARSKFRTAAGSGAGGGGRRVADPAAASVAAAAAAWATDDFRPVGRLERLAAAAMKQAQRAHGLVLRPPAALQTVLPELAAAPLCLVAAGGAPPALAQLRAAVAAAATAAVAIDRQQDTQHHHEQQQQQQQQQQQLALSGGGDTKTPWWWLVVGPEGDFTPGEARALMQAGAVPVGLGPTRLRTETAALSLLAVAAAFAEEAACSDIGTAGIGREQGAQR